MKRVPSSENNLCKMITMPKFLSVKETLVTHAYFSTALSAVADELTVEAPLNIANSLQTTSNDMFSAIYYNQPQNIENIENLALWLIVGASITSFKMFEEKRAENVYQRFEKFVSYRDIRRQMNNIFIVLFLVFVRNVPSVL